jgi:hypothetical protein
MDMWNLSVYRNAPRNMKTKARTSPTPTPNPPPPPAGKTPDFAAMTRRLALTAAL